MGYSTFHRSVCTSTPKCLRTFSLRFSLRCAPLCELPWLHLSSLVHTTREIIAINQIKSEKDLFRSSLYNSSKSSFSPSFEFLTGHPTLIAPLLFSHTFAHISKHLPALMYPYGSSRYPYACFVYVCATVAFHAHFVC